MEHVEYHWHSGSLGSDDQLSLQRIARYYHVAEVLLIYSDQVNNDTPQDEVVEVVRDTIGATV